MPVETVQEHSQTSWPLRVRGSKPLTHAAVRTIRIGLLGLGQVGQAVARLAADRAATAPAGIRFQVEQALVRDAEKARYCPKLPRITSNPVAFLRGRYDVVVEALDAVEPARTLVARLLGRGTPVVTANKALVAAHGPQLEAIAAAHGSSFRFEATALSAVPFLGTLAGDRDAYSYLPDSVRSFPLPERLAAMIAEKGLADVRWLVLAGGIIAIHSGTKR